MRRMIDKTDERRRKQMEYNRVHKITPRNIEKSIQESLKSEEDAKDIEKNVVKESGVEYNLHEVIDELEREMVEAAAAMEYERAAILRDQIYELKGSEEPRAFQSYQRKRKPKYKVSKKKSGRRK
jgi:excinuclease ABC subunit B